MSAAATGSNVPVPNWMCWWRMPTSPSANGFSSVRPSGSDTPARSVTSAPPSIVPVAAEQPRIADARQRLVAVVHVRVERDVRSARRRRELDARGHHPDGKLRFDAPRLRQRRARTSRAAPSGRCPGRAGRGAARGPRRSWSRSAQPASWTTLTLVELRIALPRISPGAIWTLATRVIGHARVAAPGARLGGARPRQREQRDGERRRVAIRRRRFTARPPSSMARSSAPRSRPAISRDALPAFAVDDDVRQRRGVAQVALGDRRLPRDDVQLAHGQVAAPAEQRKQVRVDLAAGRAPDRVEVEHRHLARHDVRLQRGDVFALRGDLDQIGARGQRRQGIERQVRMTFEALRFGDAVLLAPVLGGLELRDQRRIAARADLLRHLVRTAFGVGRAGGAERGDRAVIVGALVAQAARMREQNDGVKTSGHGSTPVREDSVVTTTRRSRFASERADLAGVGRQIGDRRRDRRERLAHGRAGIEQRRGRATTRWCAQHRQRSHSGAQSPDCSSPSQPSLATAELAPAPQPPQSRTAASDRPVACTTTLEEGYGDEDATHDPSTLPRGRGRGEFWRAALAADEVARHAGDAGGVELEVLVRLAAFRAQDLIFAIGDGDPMYENNRAVLRDPVGQGDRQRAAYVEWLGARLAVLGKDDPAVHRWARLTANTRGHWWLLVQLQVIRTPGCLASNELPEASNNR